MHSGITPGTRGWLSGMQRIELGSAVCKTSALSTVLSGHLKLKFLWFPLLILDHAVSLVFKGQIKKRYIFMFHIPFF